MGTLTTEGFVKVLQDVQKYSEDQPRDDHGRWSGGGDEGGGDKGGGSGKTPSEELQDYKGGNIVDDHFGTMQDLQRDGHTEAAAKMKDAHEKQRATAPREITHEAVEAYKKADQEAAKALVGVHQSLAAEHTAAAAAARARGDEKGAKLNETAANRNAKAANAQQGSKREREKSRADYTSQSALRASHTARLHNAKNS